MKTTRISGLLVLLTTFIQTAVYSQLNNNEHAVMVGHAERFTTQFFPVEEIKNEIIELSQLKSKLSSDELNFAGIRLIGKLGEKRKEVFEMYLHGKINDHSIHTYKTELKEKMVRKINEDLLKGEESLFHIEFSRLHQGHDHEQLRVPGAPCDNPDFETCNFNNWTLIDGVVPTFPTAPYSFNQTGTTTSFGTVNTATATPAGSGYEQHYITNGGTDPIGGFPMVYPGGTCSASIGDFTNYNYGASRITQTFLVSSSDAILTLNYAVCLEDGGHVANEQPYFVMRVYDAGGNSISCAAYEAIANDGQPGWIQSGLWWYKPWTTVFIPLAPFIGQNVTVEFTIGDCGQGGHAAYAYVDASCTAMALNMSANAVCAGQPITISAPPGAASYLWNTGATSQTINVSTGGNYSVTVTPVTGSACAITLDTTVQANPNPLAAFIDDAPVCAGTPVNFTDQSTLNGGSAINQWAWDFGDGQTSALQNPTHTYAASGTYTVTLTVTNTAGCTNTITQNVTINNNGNPVINPAGPFCTTDPAFVMTANTGGGTWTATCGTCINSATGSFDPLSAGAGTYTITYTTTGACSGTDTETVMVESVAITNVVSTDVDCFGNCNGTINITATGASQYSIDNGTTFQAGSSYATLCPNTYNIIAESPIGCQATATATIIEPTQLTLPTSNVDETCFGSCDGVAIVAPQGGTTPYNYSWSNGGGNSPTINGLCTGSYTVTVTDNNGCMAAVVINITGPPAVVINNIATTNEACQNDCTGSITITATGVTQYSIDGGATFQAGNAFANICSGNYPIVVEDAAGCQATGNAVITSPNPIILAVSNDTLICIGGTASLWANAAGGTAPLTYIWDNALPNGQAQSVNPVVSPTTYNVYAQDANGCQTNPLPIIVTINPPLVVVAQSDQAICPGQNVNISALATGGNGGPYTYVWDDGAGNLLNGPNQTVSPATTTTYIVTASDNCGTPVATDAVTITVNVIPTVTFTADDLNGCTPVSVNFTNTTNPTEVGTCFWDFGDGTTSTVCDNNHIFTTPGCYDITLTVTSPQGCEGTLTVPQMICVYPYPVAEFSFGPQPTNILMTTIGFTNESQGGLIYDWDFAGLGNSQLINPSFTFPNQDPGTYPVCLYTENQYGCADSICHDVVIDDLFLLFVPNAFTVDGDGINDYFLPIIDGIDPYSYILYIFNRWGELLFETHNPNEGWDGYYRSVMSKEDVYVWKIIAKDAVSGKKKEYYGHVSLLK